MGKGKRYETEGQLNYQKVFAVIIAIIVIIMFIFIIKNVLSNNEETNKEYEYFAVYSSNKWGVINQEGNIVIEPSYQEMIIIPDKTKDIFICMYNVNEETGEYKTKALNSKNEEIFTDYEQIEVLENSDKNDNIWFEEGILRVKKNGKYGLIDLEGKEVLSCEYDEITTLDGIENSLILVKDNKKGLANDKGSIIIEPLYKDIINLGETYKEGYITIDEQGKYGLISTTKKQILENKFDEIKQIYLNNYYIVVENGEEKIINSSGEEILKGTSNKIQSATQKGFIIKENDLYGEIDTTGEKLIETEYQELKELKENTYLAKKNDKYGIIDEVQNIKIPFEYTGITYNDKANLFIAEDENYNTSIFDKDYNKKIEGMLIEVDTENSYIRMRINDEYKYYNFNCEEKSNTEILADNTLFLSKKDGKYGYVDKKGNVVVECIYDDATEQNQYGYVAVKKNGLWGSLNSEGKEIIEAKYNLDNNLLIDFIGKWHLGEDLNMNYYCEK